MSTTARTASSPHGPHADRIALLEKTRQRILVVDDDALVLGSLRRLLDTLDVDVDTCTDPELAMRRFHAGCYDLVISDERMPKMTGSEMLKAVRANSPRTPTILLTGHGSAEASSSAYERGGVFRYLNKPWDNFDLVATVREALRAAAVLR